jgi:penicillin-binding protein 1A
MDTDPEFDTSQLKRLQTLPKILPKIFEPAASKKTVFLIAGVVLGGVLFGALIGVFIGLNRDLPQIRALEDFTPSSVSRIYSAEKQLLAEFYLEKRDPVPIDAIPQDLIAALLATEDRKFYRHSGMDLKAILRAVVKDIWAGEFVEGASTITQQLAKTLFLTPRKTLLRKMKEALLAFQLERRYTKEEILTLYLNQIYLGSGAYGVQSAARIYFDKNVEDLSLSESALIAGLPKSPSRYSPLINPELAERRRNLVLRQMRDLDIVSASEYRAASTAPLGVASQPTDSTQAPYFVDTVRRQLEDIIGPDQLYKGGLTIYTTLSHRMQQHAETALAAGLDALNQRMHRHDIASDDLQGALVALDVQSGGILAMIGGRDFYASPFNRAVSALRQPGSAFKAFIYAFAVEQGFPQNQLILDAPVVFKGAQNGEDWSPQNFSQSYLGEMTLRRALALSENIPAVRLLETLGPASVVAFCHRLGITSNLKPNLTLALGASDVSLLELTAAYAVFPNRGERVEPFGIMEIIDSQGRVIWRVKPQKRIVMSRAGAAVMTDMLQAVVENGTARRAAGLKRPLGGKTGTTDDFRDALFVGFSPSVTAGVWVGKDLNGTLGPNETGSRAALPIWIDFMDNVLDDRPLNYFDRPDDVVRVAIDPDSGQRVTEEAPEAVAALFKKGTEPNLRP